MMVAAARLRSSMACEYPRMKNDVTLSGRKGVVASMKGENTNASSASVPPASAIH